MTRRPMTAGDLLQFEFLETPALSPELNQIAYVVTQSNEELNGYQSSLYMVDSEKKEKRLTTFSLSDRLIRDQHPVWSKDGQCLYFLSNRTETKQVWSISINGGEAHPITHFDEEVSHFVLSPNNDCLICELSVSDHQLDNPDDNEDVTVIESLRYLANGEGFVKKNKQLVHYHLHTKETKTLKKGPFNAHSPSFAKDGQTIVYLKTKEDPEKHDYFSDMYIMNLETGGEQKIYSGQGSLYDPQLSPDGKWVAFAGHEGGEISPDNSGIWLLAIEGGPAQCLTENWDRPVGNYIGTDISLDPGKQAFQWDEDSQGLIFYTTEGGNCTLKHVSLEKEVSPFLNESTGAIFSFDRRADTTVIHFGHSQDIGNLYLHNSKGQQLLTHHNASFLSNIELAVPEAFTYKSVDDWTIEGWVLLPPKSVRPKERIPVILQIHGGPHTAYGNVFHHEFQFLAAKGYAVVYTNPRGSQGYGRQFTAACVGDWGQKDRHDILKGLDKALERHPMLDAKRQFVTGGSYGGFMTNMIVSHTDRFKAAVTQRCISNMYSFFGTSDIGYYFGSKQLGNVELWENEDTIMAFSPIRYARQVHTPTSIIHSEEDYRCPIEQAEQWYVALRRLGVDTRLVRFKGENHELSRSGKPKNRLTRLHEIAGWFDTYLTQEPKTI